MASKKNFEKTLSLISNSVGFIKTIDSDMEMNNAYKDNFTTEQQRSRDKKVTELLNQYVDGYVYKNKSNKWYKGILFGCCCVILVTFSVVFIVLICNINFGTKDNSINELVELISICITFLTLIVGILKIITKYVFPENEEEYITRIVEIIQNNDLENKKQNIKAQLKLKQELEDREMSITDIDQL